MKNRTTFVLAVGAFVAPLLAPVVIAQQQQQAPAQQQPPQQPPQTTPAAPADRNSVQVGVPQGRGGAQGRQGGRGQTTGGVGGGRAAAAPIPPPRNAEGRVILGGATIKDKGVWIGGGVGRRTDAELQPWARAVVADRNANELEPHTRCKASGVSRPFMTPYGVEFVELTELKRIYIFDIGGPHTEKLHTVERFTRTDLNAIRYELTVDDPGAYTKPWTATMNLRRENGTELFEYVCQQQNFAHELMVGVHERVDRTAVTVP